MLRFLIFVGGVMMASTSMAEGASTCPVDSVPIQIVGELGSSPVTTLSDFRRRAESVGSSHVDFSRYASGGYSNFNAFVPTVTEYVAARLGRENLCLDNFYSKKRSLLQFMHWNRYSSNNPPAPVTSLNTWLLFGGCRISSPWIDLTIERKPLPRIRAIVRWNERQFLADQAVLYGAKNVPPGVAKPLTAIELGHFEGEYFSREPTAKPLEERVPPDLLWLFHRTPRIMSMSYGIALNRTIYSTIARSEESYMRLVTTLIDHCLASDGADLRYNSILDVGDLIPLEQYKINDESLFWSERNAKVGVSRH